MKAAIVREAGQTPVYGDFSEPELAAGEARIAVTAAAISQVVKSRASGRHYSSAGEFAFVVGIDGVGRRDDGARVYFLFPRPPHGSMAEKTVVPLARRRRSPIRACRRGLPIPNARSSRPAKPCW
jgi:NADPH:quinone reductase-like Zn-dependent oxidoreductase